MRKFLCALFLSLLLTSGIAQAEEISNAKYELNQVHDQIIQTETTLSNRQAKERVLSQTLRELDKELAVNSNEYDALGAEKSELVSNLEPLERELSQIIADVRVHDTNYERVETQAQKALVHSYQQRPSLLDSLVKHLSLESFFQTRAFQDYWVFSAGKAYAASRDVYDQLSQEEQTLHHKVESLREAVELVEEKITQLIENGQKLSNEKAQAEQEIRLVRQEINDLDRRLLSNLSEAKTRENTLRTLMGNATLPVTRGQSVGWPVSEQGRITSDYGWREHPIFGDDRFHTGVDIAVPTGTPIKAAADGVVVTSENAGGYGLTVIVDHGNGMSTLYAHASRLLAKPGQRVRTGDTIALVGSTGYSTGPHLHFEVRDQGEHVNPWIWLP